MLCTDLTSIIQQFFVKFLQTLIESISKALFSLFLALQDLTLQPNISSFLRLLLGIQIRV
jgi:hypothetical protein